MRKVVLFIGALLLCLESCDPATSSVWFIENRRSSDAEMYFYLIEEVDTLSVPSNSIVEAWTGTAFGGIVAGIEYEEDSIIVVFADNESLKYYPDSLSVSSKSIYDMSNWNKVKVDSYDYEYTFILSDDNLED